MFRKQNKKLRVFSLIELPTTEFEKNDQFRKGKHEIHHLRTLGNQSSQRKTKHARKRKRKKQTLS